MDILAKYDPDMCIMGKYSRWNAFFAALLIMVQGLMKHT